MAFKTFTAGSVLTAAEVNDYLMKQAVIVCTAATRPSSPVEGMVIRETDTERFLTWNGTNWTQYRLGGEPDQFFTGTLSNGTATSLTAFITQNSILSGAQAPPYPYSMFVEAALNYGGNAGANFAIFSVLDEAGADINLKVDSGAVDWEVQLASSGAGFRGSAVIFGKKDYAAGTTCGFRLAYKVTTSNLYIDAGVRVSFVPRP